MRLKLRERLKASPAALVPHPANAPAGGAGLIDRQGLRVLGAFPCQARSASRTAWSRSWERHVLVVLRSGAAPLALFRSR